MKYLILILAAVGLLTAAEMANRIVFEDDFSNSSRSSEARQGIVLDMSGNQYTLTLQNHECISYIPGVDAVAVVNRAFYLTGDLNVHTAPGDLSFWVHDMSVYNGGVLYPTAFAGTAGPYVSFSGGGIAYAVYCSGGWFSGFWDEAIVLLGTGAIQICVGKELSNGNMLFISYSSDPWGLLYQTYDATLSTLIAEGWLTPTPRYYWGYDCNLDAGIAYVFYVDDGLNLYYKTTTDGVNWSDEQTYNLIWPEPFPNSVLDLNHGCQMAVADNGEPMLVFQQKDGDDPTYPYYCKVFVSHTEGEPCAEVTTAFPDSECFYPTIATGGDTVGVVFNMPRNNLDDSLCWQDIYINWSFDNGITWGTPENLTTWSTQRTAMPQLAKRLDVARNRAYIVYPTCRLPEEEMDLFWAYGGPSVSIYVNFLYAETEPGIEEGEIDIPKKILLNLFPNPVTNNQANITFVVSVGGNMSLKLFSADGRLVKTIDKGHKPAGVYTKNINTSELASGTYFLILETEKNKVSRSMVVMH